MAAAKYVRYLAGRLTELAATIVSAGAADDGKIVALDSTGKLDSTVLPLGVVPETTVATASENLAAGDFVNLHNSTGLKVRKADAAAAGKEAHGFVTAAVISGASATVYHEGTNAGVSGKTIGARQYLSAATPGLSTETPPSGSGNVVQLLGVAKSATEITFEPEEIVTLA